MGHKEKAWRAVAVDSRETPEEFLQHGGSVKKVTRGATGEDGSTFSWNASRYPAGKKANSSKSSERSKPTNTNRLGNCAGQQKS